MPLHSHCNAPHVMLSSSNTSPVGLSRAVKLVAPLSRTSLTLCNKNCIPASVQERSCTAFHVIVFTGRPTLRLQSVDCLCKIVKWKESRLKTSSYKQTQSPTKTLSASWQFTDAENFRCPKIRVFGRPLGEKIGVPQKLSHQAPMSASPGKHLSSEANTQGKSRMHIEGNPSTP